VSIKNILINSGKLYADNRGNAVFLLLGKERKVIGAELRRTNDLRWHEMAMTPGSRKDLGCFYVKIPNANKIVICESAIDALSYFTLQPDCMAISTSGTYAKPAWLNILIDKGYEIFCGFDNDETGDILANKMIRFFPTIKRLRPTKHDWNEILVSKYRMS